MKFGLTSEMLAQVHIHFQIEKKSRKSILNQVENYTWNRRRGLAMATTMQSIDCNLWNWLKEAVNLIALNRTCTSSRALVWAQQQMVKFGCCSVFTVHTQSCQPMSPFLWNTAPKMQSMHLDHVSLRQRHVIQRY